MASLAALMALTACNSASNGGGDNAGGNQAIEIKDGKFTPEVLLALGRVSDPQLSPDGTRILFNVNYQDVKENKGSSDLWVMDVDGKTPAVNITNTPGSESNAVWINEGAMIAFMYRDPAKEDSKPQVWVMKADGSGRKPVSEIENGIEGFAPVIADSRAQQGVSHMSPSELMEAALASCTNMTLSGVLRKRGIPYDEIFVDVSMETENGKTVITRRITVISDAPEADVKSAVERAKSCHLYKVLSGEIEVRDE